MLWVIKNKESNKTFLHFHSIHGVICILYQTGGTMPESLGLSMRKFTSGSQYAVPCFLHMMEKYSHFKSKVDESYLLVVNLILMR